MRKTAMETTLACAVVLGLAFAISAMSAGPADAVSLRVKIACSKDYFANCSAFRPDTPEVRKCMRAAGSKLSPRCVNALVTAGEVTKQEVTRRRIAASIKRRKLAERSGSSKRRRLAADLD